MSYNKHTWVNNVDAVDEDKMNHIENGIANAVEKSGDTMTGDLNMQSNSVKFGTTGNVLWKEDGYGDKFRIIPDFGGSGTNNKLIIQSTTGGAGEDPQSWKDLVYIHADTGAVDIVGTIGNKNTIDYQSWHSVVLTRSDDNYFYIMLYGSNLLKEGNYSIANDFRILTYGDTRADLTIPKSAISSISRKDWGFELIINRSGITGIVSGQYNGIAIVATTIRLQST